MYIMHMGVPAMNKSLIICSALIAQNAKMGVSIGGLFFVLILAVVTYNGSLLLVSPLLILLPISLSVYRRWIDYFLALWYHFPAVSCCVHAL